MATYRTRRYTTLSGNDYYCIEKKSFIWGDWNEENFWTISKYYGRVKVRTEEEAKGFMLAAVDRLVKAGHTVI